MPVHLYGSAANLNAIKKIIKKNSIFLIDDCSKDNSRDLLTNLAEKEDRIKLTFLDENIAAAKARKAAKDK